MFSFVLAVTAFTGALHAESPADLPPAPTLPTPDRNATPEPDDPPRFGADVSAGYYIGTLRGEWPQNGLSGVVFARYDAFTVPRTAQGFRLGASIWGSATVLPLQSGDEPAGLTPFEYQHYGVMAALRPDPEAPVGANAGLGFGRLDIDDYRDGPLTLPTLGFEAGVRQRIGKRAFADWMLRAHWATARSGYDPTMLEEWWMVQAGVTVGAHMR